MPTEAKLCPKCASADIAPVLQTNYGWYWRCGACGEVWHEDTGSRPKLFETASAELLQDLWELLGFDWDAVRRTA